MSQDGAERWDAASRPRTPGLFRSFWMAGFEGADHYYHAFIAGKKAAELARSGGSRPVHAKTA
jgi:hypothetical protein